MTCDEFIKACVDGGYVYRSEVKELKKWLEENPKESYTDDCFIEVYRHFEAIRPKFDTLGKWRSEFGVQKTTKRYKNITFVG